MFRVFSVFRGSKMSNQLKKKDSIDS